MSTEQAEQVTETQFDLPDELREFYQSNKQVVDVVRSLKLLAKMDTDKTLAELITAHPEAVVSIAMSLADNIGVVHSAVQHASPDAADSFTRENLALAFMTGMTLRSIHQEAELKEQYDALANAMFTATNFTEETVH